VEALAKKGPPGDVHLVGTGITLSEQEMENIANHIVKRGRNEPGSFIEVDSHGATVIQLGNMRIVITRPPFSDEIEITAVRPVRKLSIGDYSISPDLLARLEDQARGILISGGPGEGKSTFVQALAEHLSSKGHIVKTMERPRDLQVEKRITQYTALEGSMEKTGDILLLVREDYTVFDEMRVTSDFLVYSDLRMAGVGMIGVVHATRAIDSIQRFINRIELGMIPQVIDTIIFIEAGKISQVLVSRYSVKVPGGMKEEDLARPVIEILDFQTGKPVFEIYTFGEQIVVVPVAAEKEPSGLMKMAQEKIYSDLSKMLGTNKIKVSLHGEGRARVNVPEDLMSRVIGKKGATVNELEKKFGLHLDIEPLSDEYYQERRVAGIDIKNKIIYLNVEVPNQQVKFYVDNILILQARSSGKGIVRIKIQSDTGAALYNYIKAGKSVEYSVSP
jgi:ATPase